MNNIYSRIIISLFILLIRLYLITCYKIISIQYNNKYISNLNQIKLKVKGPGEYSFLSPFFETNPSIVYINNRRENLEYHVFDFPYYENDVILKFDTKIKYCNSMFKDCSEIYEIDFTDFDSSLVENINNMFEDCKSLKKINFGNFQTSKVENMLKVFKYCESLLSVDLSSFDTSNIISFSQMFYNCINLKSLDLSKFNTSSCISTSDMFYCCESIKSIKLSKFNTSKVTNMNNMFYKCYGLTSLDLSKFDLTSIKKMENMFYDCGTLELIKISNNFLFSGTKTVSTDEMLTNTANKLVFCVKELKSPKSFKFDTTICSGCSIKKGNITSFLKNHNQNDYCCYETCKECDYLGNAKYHNCSNCKTGYN